MTPIPLTDQLACVHRELIRRDGIYPVMVRAGAMTLAQMDHELACMRAVLDTLTRLDTQPSLFQEVQP